MLRSVVFLLVIISVITTPTKAYEANTNLIVPQQQIINKEQEFKTNIQLKNYSQNQTFVSAKETKELLCAFNNQTRMTSPILEWHRPQTDISSDICLQAVIKAEEAYQIKKGLLQTIASVESGRWDKKVQRRVSWPWAVQVNGKGYYYSSKEEAVNAVKELMAEGINNIDVGCMQINLKYHGEAFQSLEEAFEPEKNATYSAKFLKNLYKQNGMNWQKTAMQYHSKNIARGEIYRNKLEQHYVVYIAENSHQTLF